MTTRRTTHGNTPADRTAAPHNETPADPARRAFLRSTAAAAALGLGSVSATAQTQSTTTDTDSSASRGEADAPQKDVTAEWRNRHPDMTYRMLGRTGFMVSEVVCGGNHMKPENIDLYEAALDRGLNFLDQAIAYGKGDGEKAVAALLKRGINRDRFFLTSKLSGYDGYIRNVYEDHFKSLTEAKQTQVETLAQQLREKAQPTRTGYHVLYWDAQEKPLAGQYRMMAMKQLGFTAGSKKQFKDRLRHLLDVSFGRTTADHYDVLYCPHSVESPEAFDDEALHEEMPAFRKEGKARALAFSCHNDTGRILEAGSATGLYDVAMVGYNIVNHLMMDPIIEAAHGRGVGVIAMKVARPVIVDAQEWRIAKLNEMVPGDELSLAQKAYLFALQNPHLSAVISDMKDQTMIDENLSLAGRKVTLQLV
ncbi:MAG: aldo/keto reductase [Planctomycetota bacterium]